MEEYFERGTVYKHLLKRVAREHKWDQAEFKLDVVYVSKDVDALIAEVRHKSMIFCTV